MSFDHENAFHTTTICVGSLGCAIQPITEPELGTARAALGPVKNETECAYGAGANACLRIEPIDSAAIIASYASDGIQKPNEYVAATEVGFTNVGEQATGRLFFTVDTKKQTLRVFAKDIPLPPKSSKIAIFFDVDRFNASSDVVNGADLGFQYDVDSGAKVSLTPFGSTPSSVRWIPTTTAPAWAAKAANIRGTIGTRRRVDFEFSYFIGSLAGTTTALGFALATQASTDTDLGAFPEDLGILGLNRMWNVTGTPFGLRRNLQPLVFKPPPGNALTYMTWNVKRFTKLMQTVEDAVRPAFPALNTSSISNASVGEFIGQKFADVVALQELWDADGAEEILKAANTVRRAKGLVPYEMVGPSDFAPSILAQLPGNVSLRPDQTNGGVYIFSARPAMTFTRTA
jgi:hypothetical protein